MKFNIEVELDGYGTHHYEDKNGGCENCEYWGVGYDVSKWLDKEWKEI